MIILDTDHLSLFQQAGPAAAHLRARFAAVEADQDLAVTIVTVEEVLRGWLAVIHRAASHVGTIAYYDRLYRFLNSLADWLVVPFDAVAASRAASLRQSGVRIGTKDVRIAAIALTQNALLLSANLKDSARCQV